jgi:hypothetical protein
VKLQPTFVSLQTSWSGLYLIAGALLCLSVSFPGTAKAQSSSSSAAPENRAVDMENPVNRPRAAQIERGGAAVTLEVSEPLFQIAAGLNACGYDADLDKSPPVRAEVRAEMNSALAASESARDSRDKLCVYISEHRLNDLGLDIGQYVSLALYLSPPPELTPNVDLTQLPPQAASVVNVLPLLRTFGDEIHLHYIWLQHRAEYEALTARVHDPGHEHLSTPAGEHLRWPPVPGIAGADVVAQPDECARLWLRLHHRDVAGQFSW